MILVTGFVIALRESLAEMTCISLEHVHRSHAEPGCLEHAVRVGAENPLKLYFFERWADTDALKAHFAVPASRTFWRKLHELAADLGGIHIYDANETSLP